MKTGHEFYKHDLFSDIEIDCLMTVKAYRFTNGYSPLYSELAELLKVTKNQVTYAMKKLELVGMIEYKAVRGHGYVPTKAGEMFKPAGYQIGTKHRMFQHYELTDTQVIAMRGINQFTQAHSIPPTFSDLMAECSFASTAAVSYIVRGLRELGYLEEGKNQRSRKVLLATAKGLRVGQLWQPDNAI